MLGTRHVAALDRLDAVFAALSDPTRRAILARLVRGECSVTTLGRPFAVSAPAISKHLRVLESSGLITREQERPGALFPVRADSLREAGDWDRATAGILGAPVRFTSQLPGQGRRRMQQAIARIGNAFRLQRRFAASREKVFRAWTDPEALIQWWCPEGWIPAELRSTCALEDRTASGCAGGSVGRPYMYAAISWSSTHQRK